MSHNRKQHRKGAPRVNDTSKDDAAAARTLASAAAAPRAKLLILDKFTTLPYELQHHIIELACCPAPLPPPPSSSAYAPPGTGSPPMRLSVRARRDLNPAFSLALASRKLYALVVPLLYSSVWITRPSSLAAFHLALTAKPALGRSVRSLHVGPCEEGPEWEPTHYQQEELISHSFDSESASLDSIASARASIYTSLRDDKEAARRLLPKWCKSDRRWPLDWPDSNGGPSAAVYNALEEAQRVIDINLPRFSYNGKGQRISFPQREVRLGEVQAALDLYLIKMRRWEDERGIEHLQVADSDEDEDEDESSSEGEEQDSGEEQDEKGKRKLRDDDLKYPTLYLTGYPIRPRSTINDKPLNSTELFTLDRADILQHLARRHAPSDRFDHPLLFSRAGLSIVKYDGWKYEPGSRKPYVDSERADTWDEELFSPPCTTPDYALPNTATLGSLLSLLSSVLSHTPNIQNLSLSGFLERAVCGNRPTLAMLKKLRYLSLGPPPNVWWAPLRLAALPDGLQDLRLCGIRLHEEQLEDVIKMLPSLKTFQWSMIHRYSREHRPRLEDAIAGLVGTKTRPVTEQEAAPNSKTSSREDASSTAGRDEDSTETPLPVGSATEEMVDNSSRHSSSSASSASSSSFPLIEIRLHPKDLQRYLKKVAPSPETRSAWETGAALPGQQRRLLLTESRTILKKPTWWKPETSLQELYDEGREWWEDRAGDGNGLRLG